MDLVLRGGRVLTQNAKREVLDADVWIKDGRIHAVGNVPELPAARVLDCAGMWVTPGFVQAHVHLTQALFRGLADGRDLLEWLADRIWPLEAAHDPETNYISAELGISELLLTGTTTLLDMGTTHHHDAVFEAARDLGIRYYGGKALMDTGVRVPAGLLQDRQAALRECDAQQKKWHGVADRLSFVYAPRFILSCTDELLRSVGERSRADDVLIHTHANESPGEQDAVKAVTGTTNLRALQARGCLHGKTIVAHGVWIDGDEEECLVQSGAAVCHCPGSNLKLRSGIANVPRLLSRGVRVGLGADGAACNNTLDQRFEMRLASLLHRLGDDLSAQQAFDLATLGGAAALGRADELGSVEVGKRADLVCFAPGLGCVPTEDPVTALVYGATDAKVVHTIVGGALAVRDGVLEAGDLKTLPARAFAAAKAVKNRVFER